jgi:hypothetical protein
METAMKKSHFALPIILPLMALAFRRPVGICAE